MMTHLASVLVAEVRAIVRNVKCLILGHDFSPRGHDYPRSHCRRCGRINPDDWADLPLLRK